MECMELVAARLRDQGGKNRDMHLAVIECMIEVLERKRDELRARSSARHWSNI